MARNDDSLEFFIRRTGGEVLQTFKPFLFKNPNNIQPVERQEFFFDPSNPDSPTGSGELGLPVYGNIFIESDAYTDVDGNNVASTGMNINTVIMVVSQTKNIVRTPISGRNGTIKEYINDGDYDIQITGILSSGENNVEPSAQIDNLVAILQASANVKISSDYLDRLGITEMVITSYNLPQKAGYRDNFFFNISAISDRPFELRLKEDI